MTDVLFSPKADQDIRDIWRNIASDDENAADRFLLKIFEKAKLLGEHPQLGSPRPELSATARILIEGNYIIVYEPTEHGVLVVAIVHGVRDQEAWL